MDILIVLSLIGLATLGVVVLCYLIGIGALVTFMYLPFIISFGGMAIMWINFPVGVGLFIAGILWLRWIDYTSAETQNEIMQKRAEIAKENGLRILPK